MIVIAANAKLLYFVSAVEWGSIERKLDSGRLLSHTKTRTMSSHIMDSASEPPSCKVVKIDAGQGCRLTRPQIHCVFLASH